MHDELDMTPATSDGKVTADVAEAELERFFDAMDLDVDKTHMDEEDKAGFEASKRTLVKAMTDGRLVINDDGEPVFYPKTVDVDSITFREPTGAVYMEMDRKKKGHDVGKMMAIMGGMTGQAPNVFAKMKQRDYKVCQSVVSLFLG